MWWWNDFTGNLARQLPYKRARDAPETKSILSLFMSIAQHVR